MFSFEGDELVEVVCECFEVFFDGDSCECFDECVRSVEDSFHDGEGSFSWRAHLAY